MQTIRLIPDPFWQDERVSEPGFITALTAAGADASQATDSYRQLSAERSAAVQVADDADLRTLADALPGYTIVQLPEDED